MKDKQKKQKKNSLRITRISHLLFPCTRPETRCVSDNSELEFGWDMGWMGVVWMAYDPELGGHGLRPQTRGGMVYERSM